MKKILTVMLSIGLLFGLSGVAAADLLTFEGIDLGSDGIETISSYGGLNWQGFQVIDTTIYGDYAKGNVSPGTNVAGNIDGGIAITSAGSFTFNSAYFTWKDLQWEGVDLRVDAVQGSNTVTDYISLDWLSGSPVRVLYDPTIDFSGISSLTFTPWVWNSDSDHSQGGASTNFTYFAMDNMDVTFGGTTPAVPEPATMLLLGSGLIGLAGIGRKRFFKKG